jgi:hypothetical protein
MKITLLDSHSPDRVIRKWVFHKRIGSEIRICEFVRIYQTVRRGMDHNGYATWHYFDNHFVTD